MPNIKKAILATLSFFLLLIILSLIVIEPYWSIEDAYYKDRRIRNELAGKLDFLLSGSSYVLNGFDPAILDQELGCNSYNLGTASVTLEGRKWLLEKELARNPIKTVVIELSLDNLAHGNNDAGGGNTSILCRMDSLSERWSYFWKNVPINEWLHVYSRLIRGGSEYRVNQLLGRFTVKIDDSQKGFLPMPATDIQLTREQAHERHHSGAVFQMPSAEQTALLYDIFDLCKSHDARVIAVVTPLSNQCIWEGSDYAAFQEWTENVCREADCELYDFNLLKQRYELFHDTDSFYDRVHLSESGAKAFTEVFCEVLQAHDIGQDVSDWFYEDYAAMCADSPYTE